MPRTTFSSDYFKSTINFAFGLMGVAGLVGLGYLGVRYNQHNDSSSDDKCMGHSPCESFLFTGLYWLPMALAYGVTAAYKKMPVSQANAQAYRNLRADSEETLYHHDESSAGRSSCALYFVIMTTAILQMCNFIPELYPAFFYPNDNRNPRFCLRAPIWVVSIGCAWKIASLVHGDQRQQYATTARSEDRLDWENAFEANDEREQKFGNQKVCY